VTVSYYLLLYDVVENFLERRLPFRQAHLELVQQAHEHGELLMAGGFRDPADGALLIFQAEDPSPAEQFATIDPYVSEGLVTAWRVRQWHEVLTSA
jgi:uncharacterized protein YciI